MHASVISLAACWALVGTGSGCLTGATRQSYDALLRESAAPASRRGPASPPGDLEAELARAPRLTTILRLIGERHPELAEARSRLGGLLERVPAASRLPDLELRYEQRGVPVVRPHRLDRADGIAFGLRQSFPALGLRDASSRVALEEARAAAELLRAKERDLLARARRAFIQLYQAERELELQQEHVALVGRLVELSRATYQSGQGSQHDVLRLVLEQTRQRARLLGLDEERRLARLQLNTLMARRPDAPLGVPPPPALAPQSLSAAALEALLHQHRAELRAADHAVLRSTAAVEASRSVARWPTLMIGADYMVMPAAMDSIHTYGLMLGANLPWLNPLYADRQREAEALLAADRRAKENLANLLRQELREALVRVQTLGRTRHLIHTELLPQARQSFDAARAAYAAGQGEASALVDALRTLLEVRLEEHRTLAQLAAAEVELERAVGRPVAPAPTSGGDR